MALPKELIRKIRKIEIFSKRMVQNQLSGQYHSVFKGAGIAFSEIRQYMPGDEIRSIDWNVTARMNEAFVKVFTEERDRTVVLLIDASASTLFGSSGPSKRDQIAEIAALIAFSAIENQDRVGLVMFTDKVEKYIPPRRGRKHVLRILTDILTTNVSGTETDVGNALKYFANVTTRPTVAFLISDLQSDGWDDAFKFVARRHDLIPVVVTDPMEQDLPKVGVIPLQDLETGAVTMVDTSSASIDRLRRSFADNARRIEQLALQTGCDLVHVSTNDSSVDALSRFFKDRERRLGR